MSSGAVFFLRGGLWDGAAESVTVCLFSDQHHHLPACTWQMHTGGDAYLHPVCSTKILHSQCIITTFSQCLERHTCTLMLY